jgi:hypothetical protein
MPLALLGLLLISISTFAQEAISFRNDREGRSVFSSPQSSRSIKKALKTISSEEIVSSWETSLEGLKERQLCSFDLTTKFNKQLQKIRPEFIELKGAILHLREVNEIDDVTTKILFKAIDTNATFVTFLSQQEQSSDLPRDRKKLQEMRELIAKFQSLYLKRGCYDEAYRLLVSDLTKIMLLRDSQLESLYRDSFEAGGIDLPTYQLLERARLNKLNEIQLDLKSYHTKLRILRTQYPLRDSSEKSDFTTVKVDKTNSRRQKLLENYNELQIIMMGNVVKKLRKRLESDRIEILVFAKDELQETIQLEPMERFSFAVKILRKEMLQLSQNTYFAGRMPSYIDLMTASYETGIIPAVELDEIAGLEEIWNPHKTLWEKASIWVKIFAPVATLMIPPPYGFVPALAIVAIEATVGKKEQKSDNGDLF